MQPLTCYKVGKPGSSFAFEIDKKIGFPVQVLNSDQKEKWRKTCSFRSTTSTTRKIDKIKLQKQLQKADSYDANLNQMIEKYSDLINNLEKIKKTNN